MNPPPFFEIIGDRAEFRPVGDAPLAEAVKAANSAIAYAREQGIRKLLMVATGLTGFQSPEITARYFFVKEWALTAGREVQMAVVIPPEMLDPRKFGVTVARNMGATMDSFTSEPEALAWLESLD